MRAWQPWRLRPRRAGGLIAPLLAWRRGGRDRDESPRRNAAATGATSRARGAATTTGARRPVGLLGLATDGPRGARVPTRWYTPYFALGRRSIAGRAHHRGPPGHPPGHPNPTEDRVRGRFAARVDRSAGRRRVVGHDRGRARAQLGASAA